MEKQEKLNRVLAMIDERIPSVETVRLKPSRAAATVFDSKMGGTPYFPRSMKYPTVRGGEHEGKPLSFLAQLNFGKLPKIEGFPTEGILQFYTGHDGDEYAVGMNYDDMLDQNAFRVIYHEKVIDDVSQLLGGGDIPRIETNEMFPLKDELLLIAEECERMPAMANSQRFYDALAETYNAVSGTDFKDVWGNGGLFDADEDFCNAVFDARNVQGTRIGGYPSFAQDDPRGRYPDYTVLLFQSDTEWNGNDELVSWGGDGVANFFITPEDLEKRDFSRVMYNWACG